MATWNSLQVVTLVVDALTAPTAPTAQPSIELIQSAHDRLAECFRTDLYVARETRSILTAAP